MIVNTKSLHVFDGVKLVSPDKKAEPEMIDRAYMSPLSEIIPRFGFTLPIFNGIWTRYVHDLRSELGEDDIDRGERF